jgi:hypothetical protein
MNIKLSTLSRLKLFVQLLDGKVVGEKITWTTNKANNVSIESKEDVPKREDQQVFCFVELGKKNNERTNIYIMVTLMYL